MKQLGNFAIGGAWAVLVFALGCGEATAEKPSFDDATRAPYSPPPEKSRNGKSIAGMKEKVKAAWGDIVFTKNGKPVQYQVTLETSAGDMVVDFYPDVAPNHVRSFIALAQVGFYDGLIFHRCIPGFVIQGGCPLGNGLGGPGYCLKPEFNKKLHLRGVLSMARATPKDSAGSQFFVCVAKAPNLDNQYTVFGAVTKGLDVMDKIVGAPRGAGDRPFNPVVIKSAKVTIKK